MPLFLLVANGVFFFVLLPGSVAVRHANLFALLGGFVTFVLAFWTFAKTTPKLAEKFAFGTNILSFLSLFAFALLFTYRTSKIIGKYFEEDGVLTTATIIGMSQTPEMAGSPIFTIKVAFQTKAKTAATASVNVSEKVYGNLTEGMEVPVLYSERNPGIAAMASDQKLNHYSKQNDGPAMKTVAHKMGVREGSRSLLRNAPAEAVAALQLPDLDLKTSLSGDFDYIHLFAMRRWELESAFEQLKKHLRSGGALWVSWPKGGQLDTDLNLREVIRIGYSFGLVESTTLSVDENWSAIKFTHPKPGKTYRNSYGELPSESK